MSKENFVPDGRCTQFNLSGTNYYGYRKGELGNYEYVVYKKNARGICREVMEDLLGAIRVTINGKRTKTSKEIVVCEMCREGGLYSDRINLGIIGFENYESLVTGEIRSVKLPDRPKRIYGEFNYQVYRAGTNECSYLHGIKTRASIDPKLNDMMRWGVEESVKHGFVRPIDRLVLSNKVMFNWKDYEEKKRIFAGDIVWLHSNVPNLDNPELIVTHPKLCVDVDAFGEIGVTLYDTVSGVAYELTEPSSGVSSHLTIEEKKDKMLWKPKFFNFNTKEWYSKTIVYGALNKNQKYYRTRFYWTTLKKGIRHIVRL